MSTCFEILAAYYGVHNPQLVPKVEDVLAQFPGADGWLALSAKLESKYATALPVPRALAREVEELKAQQQSQDENAARDKARARARARAQARRGSGSSVASSEGGGGAGGVAASGRRGSGSSVGSERRPSRDLGTTGRRPSSERVTGAVGRRGSSGSGSGDVPPASGGAGQAKRSGPATRPAMRPARPPPSPKAADVPVAETAPAPTPTAAPEPQKGFADAAQAARERARAKAVARQLAKRAKRGGAAKKPPPAPKPAAPQPQPEPEPEPEPEQASTPAPEAVPEGVPPHPQLSPVPETLEQPSPAPATPPRQPVADRLAAAASGSDFEPWHTTESNDDFLRLEQQAAQSPSPREGQLRAEVNHLQQQLQGAETLVDAKIPELETELRDAQELAGQIQTAVQSAKAEDARVVDLCQRTDALAGQDARALIREMVTNIPAVQEWLGDYQFPAGTTFRPLQSQRSAARPAASQQPGYMAAVARTPNVAKRGSAAGSTLLSLLRQQLKSLSYSTSGQDPRKLFSLYDRDNSGALDAKEFANAIRKGGRVTAQQMSDAELEQLFRAADTDGCASTHACSTTGHPLYTLAPFLVCTTFAALLFSFFGMTQYRFRMFLLF
jgi:hypothetical protein